ncbi:cGMP-dependent protein kinase, isozyme 1-like [Chrysoperla carnea]|uniref:cGMP-dependent protein kinase, isozyme 1-like n=1 Tax=Chrysoperla carnea TaxID=189513 RepID=UPI001D05C701|nr:cGMP-dependent protein kinase, isozyme 1-like [Chrysoperla carnea]XP_044736581.1 cGMP-dependent protein kinase, isozyme 1-like [Chrysoperla carnea]
MKFSCLPRIMGCRQSYIFPKPEIERNSIVTGHFTPKISTDNPQKPSIASNKTEDQRVSDDSDLPRVRRPGIPGNRKYIEENEENVRIIKIDKDSKSEELIRKAFENNDFLNHFCGDKKRMKLIVEVMYAKEIEADSFIIKEGETGSHLFVSASGSFEVLNKDNEVVKKFEAGEAFGELAILYSAKRLASVKVLTPAKVWVLDRLVFQKIIHRTVVEEQDANIKFLKSCPLFEKLHKANVAKIADLLKPEFFESGKVIVRQGDTGDKFYIIKAGTVKFSKKIGENGFEESFGTRTRGEYFGELALRKEGEVRQATVTALDSGVECLTLDRIAFTKYLGNLDELKNDGIYNDPPVKRITSEFAYVELEDLNVIGTLGEGGFGRVDLVQYRDDTNLTFALKKLKKIEMVQQQQQEHAFNEKNIMINCNSIFICRLYKTYRDAKYLYFLIEACLGGDVWTTLQKKREFNEATAKFMSACVIEAFEYLHKRNFVYRDLKPENLMLDAKGYIKIVDFGFAKKVADGTKTWTFAGTPEYVAPEIILNRGHNRAVDYWALGILIHELLVGKPPFRGRDHMSTYNLILKGIDRVPFSPRIPNSTQHLIKKLCRFVPTERLGCFRDGIKDIKNHRWYLGFDWDALKAGTMPAPLINPVRNNQDLSNFDRQRADDDDPPEEESGWDRDFDK